MLYLDTSLLVAILAREPDTDRLRTWLAERESEKFAVSDWVVAEFSAALSIKLRTGRITLDYRAAVLKEFADMVAHAFERLPISAAHFRTAAHFADRHSLGLRAGDALHLAVASDQGATLCTLDRRLAAAGSELGVRTLLV
jgi:predicted nucleic acid-binding protein